MINRQLNFSSDYLNISEIHITGSFTIKNSAILVNLFENPIINNEDQSIISRLQSRLVNNIEISSHGATACLIQTHIDEFLTISQEANKWFKENWDRASVLEPHIEELKSINQYKSNIDTINDYSLNFWYLEKNSKGLIYKHSKDKKEIHTQILGTGMMQKYKEKSYKTTFETAYMIPGYTHYPFYNSNDEYPWHSYNSITNSVFLAIVPSI